MSEYLGFIGLRLWILQYGPTSMLFLLGFYAYSICEVCHGTESKPLYVSEFQFHH